MALRYARFSKRHTTREKDARQDGSETSDILRASLERDIPVSSTRAGHIPGTHLVGFDSPADQITLMHTARNREGFAAGALLAAEWIQGREGVYEFSGVFDEIIELAIHGQS